MSPQFAAPGRLGGKSYQRVEHVRRKEDAWNVHDVVGRATDAGGQRPEADGGRLSDDNPRSRRRSQGETDRNDETQGRLCQRGRGRPTDGACDAKSDQEADVDQGAPDVDGPPAEIGREDPGQHDEDGLQGGGDKTESEGKVGVDTGLC